MGSPPPLGYEPGGGQIRMHMRKLGGAGVEVPVVGLGMGMSEIFGPAEVRKSIDVIRRALQLGVTFIFTADKYGSGQNDALVGRALRGSRGQAVLATKLAGASGAPEHV